MVIIILQSAVYLKLAKWHMSTIFQFLKRVLFIVKIFNMTNLNLNQSDKLFSLIDKKKM